MHQPPPLDPAAPRTRTVLIADGDRETRHALGERLGRLGYAILLCARGGEALDLIAGGGVDLALIDARLADMSGIDVVRELRAAPATRDLAAILLAERPDAVAAAAALAAGADDHFTRSLAIEEVAARIARVLAQTTRIAELKRANVQLDARVTARAIELGETRDALARSQAERRRLQAALPRRAA